MNELEVAESARFVTLTYDEKYLPWINENGNFGTLWDTTKKQFNGSMKLEETLNKKDLQKFVRDLRNEIISDHWEIFKGSKIEEMQEAIRWVKKSEITQKWSPKLRYFACGEYGTRGRPHYHIILFNVPRCYYEWDPVHEEEYSPKLEKIWNKGIIHIGNVERRSAHYTAKYTIKNLLDNWDTEDIRQKPFAIMSKNPGIGANYINDETRDHFTRSENYFTRLKGGYIQPLGRYYKKKIWEPKKEKQKFSYVTETGKKITTETSGVSIQTKAERNAIKKTGEYVKKMANAEKDQILGENFGDLGELEFTIIKRKNEAEATAWSRARKNKLNGKKL
jgi:hypothetical protein